MPTRSVTIPEWAPELEFSDDPLEQFVYHNEPGESVEFRAQLQALVDSLLNGR
jgi:hypothetical protein